MTVNELIEEYEKLNTLQKMVVASRLLEMLCKKFFPDAKGVYCPYVPLFMTQPIIQEESK